MKHSVPEILEALAQQQDLREDEAEFVFNTLMDGMLSPAQAGAFLMGLRAKGETAPELAAGVKAALDHAALLPQLPGKTIDTCGTGGDGSCSFNCSTAVALILAGMGYNVVKHGNRSISGKCGSADVVEALDLPLPTEPEKAAEIVQDKNFVFLFAPAFHPAFKHIMPIRKDLGIRTLFNLMGPLLNPARPTHQLLGVAKPEIMHLMAEALLLSGIEKAVVVHGAGGFDELTPFGTAKAVWVGDGKLVETEIDPSELGIESCTPADVAVTDKEQALSVLKEILAGKGPKPMQEMVVLNLAVAVNILETGMGMSECVEKARAAVVSGVGARIIQ